MWDNYKEVTNIQGITRRENRRKISETIMTQYFPKLMPDTKPQFRKLREDLTGKLPKKKKKKKPTEDKKPTPRHSIFKLQKI